MEKEKSEIGMRDNRPRSGGRSEEEEMINIGIIGAGRIGKVHLQSITYHVKNACVKAVADPFMNEETESFVRGMGVQKVCRDYKEILADPEIQAVLVCSSTDTHASISIEAIEAGKHVFCEKPVDHSLARIQAVADALAVTTTAVMFSMQFRPAMARLEADS